MEVHVAPYGRINVVALTGELDGRTASQVEERLRPLVQPGCRLLLDMKDVSYMSSAGLRILLLLYRQIANQDGRVVVTELPDMIRDTMAMTGFLDFFEYYPSRADGLAALQAAAS